ncbi:MFS transporter [Adlercreutzia aquisgranensis]|uniref:MFS transporter n=1 Tax=Adlercreutzia aquisgranensis TaxID=2941323 RepID=UPI00203A86D4|nr:MFS transporter [Adlercreutzia aquisgranensis]
MSDPLQQSQDSPEPELAPAPEPDPEPKPETPKRRGAKLWTRDFVMGTIVNFVLCANYFMLMVVMTSYALNVYHAPASVAAFCASIFIIGTLVARFTTATLMARFGQKRTLAIGAATEIALTAMYFLGASLPLLLTVRFLHGFSYGTCSTATATIVTAMVPPERKGEGIGYYMLSVTLGAAMGPFAGIYLSNNFGYEVLFTVAMITAAISVPCVLALRRPAADRAQAARDAGAPVAAHAACATDAACLSESFEQRAEEAALADVAAEESDAPAERSREEQAAASLRVPSTRLERRVTNKVQGSWAERFIEAPVLPISLVAGLIFFGYSALLTFLTPYAFELGLSRAASVFFVAYALSMFITRPFTGVAFDRYGPHPVMVPAFIAYCAGMVVVAFMANDWALLGGAMILGFGVGTIQSCGLAMAVRETPDDRLSVANATFYILLDVGVGIGPLFLGLIEPAIGYSNMYLLMAGVGALALALFLVVAKTEL